VPKVTVGRENSADIEIHYEDHGAGQPVVLIHSYLLQTPDNPDGVPQSVFDGFAAAAAADTPAWIKGFLDALRGTAVSDQAWQASWNLAVTASAAAAVACIGTWTTDFRADLPKIDVPVLVLHGDADQVLPLDKTAKRLPGLIKDMQLTVIEGGPHAIPWTHAGQVNTALLDFLRR
jgi:non-heme chloroperoxidase